MSDNFTANQTGVELLFTGGKRNQFLCIFRLKVNLVNNLPAPYFMNELGCIKSDLHF